MKAPAKLGLSAVATPFSSSRVAADVDAPPDKGRSVLERIAPSGLLTTEQAAEYLNIAPATMAVWRSTNRQKLTWVRIGGLPRYRMQDLDAFIAANVREVPPFASRLEAPRSVVVNKRFAAPGIADTALVIEGEAYALAYLDRMRNDTAPPDDLATLMSFLTGAMLSGACRVIEKALKAEHRHA